MKIRFDIFFLLTEFIFLLSSDLRPQQHNGSGLKIAHHSKAPKQTPIGDAFYTDNDLRSDLLPASIAIIPSSEFYDIGTYITILSVRYGSSLPDPYPLGRITNKVDLRGPPC
jgi:hypothetical protein